LEEKIRGIDIEHESDKRKIGELEKTKSNLEQRIEHSQQLSTNKQSTIDRLIAEHTNAMNLLQSEKDQMAIEVRTLENKVPVLEQDVNRLTQDLRIKEAQLSDANAKNDELIRANEGRQTIATVDAERFRANNADFLDKQDLKNLRDSRPVLNKKVADLEASNNQLQEIIQEAEEELRKSQQAVSSLWLRKGGKSGDLDEPL